MKKTSETNDVFEQVAKKTVIYNLKTSWLQIAKLYDKMAAEHNVTMSMAFVLLSLYDDKGTPVTKIAPRLGMEPNSLSRVLKNLAAQKLIERQKDKKDKRKVFLSLTETGKQMRKIALKAVFNLEKAITKDISQEELTAFFKVAQHIPNAIDDFLNNKNNT